MRLSNGVEVPQLALGTWFIENGNAADAIREAVNIGYRHFDTAQAYGNESGVGEGIRTCGISREDIFVTSKVAAEHKTYESAEASINESLKKMGLEYIDLMIIHSPQPWRDVNKSPNRYFEGNKEAWKALEDALDAGKLRSIGVSNFLKADIENIWGSANVKPMVNQILCHISNTPIELIRYCQGKGMVMEAYSPVAHGEALKNGKIIEMANKYGVSVPQLCIRYDIQLGMVVLPKTENPEHMKSNADIDFVISDADMDVLINMERIKDYGEHSRFPVFGGLKQ